MLPKLFLLIHLLPILGVDIFASSNLQGATINITTLKSGVYNINNTTDTSSIGLPTKYGTLVKFNYIGGYGSLYIFCDRHNTSDPQKLWYRGANMTDWVGL